MITEPWHHAIIAYRLEDRYGNSPYFGCNDGYLHAVLNPCRFKESDYIKFYYIMDVYEYLLFPTAKIKDSNVLFQRQDIISKRKLRR